MPHFENLNEIIKLSALRATGALSKLLKFPIGVDIVPIEIKTLDEIESMVSSHQKIVGSYIPLTGNLSGASLLVYTKDSAQAICDALLHRNLGETQEFTQTEVSALREVANIIIGNFLTAFAVPLNVDNLMHRTPDFNSDNFDIFLKRVTSSLPKDIKDGLIVNISFHFQHVNIFGTAIFLFNEKEMELVTKKLGTIFSD